MEIVVAVSFDLLSHRIFDPCWMFCVVENVHVLENFLNRRRLDTLCLIKLVIQFELDTEKRLEEFDWQPWLRTCGLLFWLRSRLAR